MDAEQQLGDPSQAPGPASLGATGVDADEVAESELPGADRSCPSCRAINAATDRFCTSCGGPLTAPVEGGAEEQTAALMSTPPAPLPLPWAEPQAATDGGVAAAEQGEAPLRTGRRPRWVWFVRGIAALLIAAGLAGTIVFYTLWDSELARADRLSSRLAGARAELAQTRADLDQTAQELQAARSLSEKRRAVLVRARDVLKHVDPLLTSVDELQGVTAEIQGQRDEFSRDADALISTMITLVNYLVDTNSYYLDYGYLNGLIDQANAELNAVRADQSALGISDSTYNDASRRFGNRADAFTKSVRGLQRQLKDVTAG